MRGHMPREPRLWQIRIGAWKTAFGFGPVECL